VTLGDLGTARRLFEQAADIYRRTPGPKSADYARALNNLAGVDRQRRDLARALPLMDQATRLARAAVREHHPLHATCLNNPDTLWETSAALRRPRTLYERSLKLRREVLGPRHPESVAGLANLAGLTWREGRRAEAAKLLQQALAGLNQHLDDTLGALSGRQRL